MNGHDSPADAIRRLLCDEPTLLTAEAERLVPARPPPKKAPPVGVRPLGRGAMLTPRPPSDAPTGGM